MIDNYGIRIAKEGKDISSAEPTDYIFNSAYGSVKVIRESSNKNYQLFTVPASSSAILTINHGQSFVPLIIPFFELKPGSGHWYMGGNPERDPDDVSAAVSINTNGDTYVDGVTINIKFTNSTASPITIKYYIFIFGDNG